MVEAQTNDPSYNAFRLWIAAGREGPPPHQRPQEAVPEADPKEMQWLSTQGPELVDLTRRGRESHGEVLVRVADPTLRSPLMISLGTGCCARRPSAVS